MTEEQLKILWEFYRQGLVTGEWLNKALAGNMEPIPPSIPAKNSLNQVESPWAPSFAIDTQTVQEALYHIQMQDDLQMFVPPSLPNDVLVPVEETQILPVMQLDRTFNNIDI